MENKEFEIIRKSSRKFHINKEVDNEEIDLCRRFVLELLTGMAKLSCLFFHEMSENKYCAPGNYEFPYTCHERQLESIIVPTLSNMCKGKLLTELSIDRKSKYMQELEYTSGRADFWCIYQDYTFIIEVKHGYDNFSTDVTRKDSVIDQWNTMIKQLNSIDRCVKDICQERTKGIIRLGLHFITSYAEIDPITNTEVIKQYRSNIDDMLIRIERDLGQGRKQGLKPDLMACWEVPKDMVEDCDTKAYPGLIVAAKALRTLKK